MCMDHTDFRQAHLARSHTLLLHRRRAICVTTACWAATAVTDAVSSGRGRQQLRGLHRSAAGGTRQTVAALCAQHVRQG